MAGEFTSSTFGVIVLPPGSGGNLVGEENQGWKLITNQLNHERVAICPASGILRSIEEVRWAQQTHLADGRRVIDQEWVRTTPCPLSTPGPSCSSSMNWEDRRRSRPRTGRRVGHQVFGTERVEVYQALMEVVGETASVPRGLPREPSLPGASNATTPRPDDLHVRRRRERSANANMIGMVGLGMPRRPR